MEDLMKGTNIFYNILCFLISENESILEYRDVTLYYRTVFHSLVILHHSCISLFALGLDLESESIEIKMLKKYRAGYLTGWSFVFQSTFLFLAVSHDVLQWLDKHEGRWGYRIKYWRDVIFSGLVVPITLFVAGMFWTIYAIDRELVFPKVYDEIVPWWFNHCVHTNIVIVIALETLLQPRRRPRDERTETMCVVICTVLYAVVYYSIYFFTGRWLYEVFGTMTWWQVCIFQSLIWLVSYVFYRIQFPINRLIHGQDEDEDGEVVENKNGIANGHNGINGVNSKIMDDKDKISSGVNVEHIEKINDLGKLLNGTNVNGVDKVDGTDKLDGTVNGIDDVSGTVKDGINVEISSMNGDSVRRDSNSPPFADRSWSLKYRSLRSQFEKTSL